MKAMKELTYIDRRLQNAAAKLLEDYLEGKLSGMELQRWTDSNVSLEDFADEPFDTGLDAIFNGYVANLPQCKLDDISDPKRQNEIRQVLTRCSIFLSSDRPYLSTKWPRESICIPIISGIIVFPGGVAVGIVAGKYLERPISFHTTYWIVSILWFFLVGALLVIASFARQRQKLRKALLYGRLRHWPFASGEDMETAQTRFGNLGMDKTQ